MKQFIEYLKFCESLKDDLHSKFNYFMVKEDQMYLLLIEITRSEFQTCMRA